MKQVNKKRLLFSCILIIALLFGTVALAQGDTRGPFTPLTTPEELEKKEPLNLTIDLYNMYGEKVLSTTTKEYKDNQEAIDKKYNIGEYSPAKIIIRYLDANGEINQDKIKELCPEVSIDKTIEIMIKENVIETKQGSNNQVKITLTNQMKEKLIK